uniref:Extracellular calcium-sensing receptor-like n=1 Tax=Gouania willdenowi TaxID=441366 RepID=A0A8C5HTG4_GOUWI
MVGTSTPRVSIRFCVFVCVCVHMCIVSAPNDGSNCRLISASLSLPVLEKNGDIILGGLFSLHDTVVEPSLSFTAMPAPTQCTRFNFRTFRWMQTMIFAIEEINRDGTLLPNITLGYKIYDSCSTPHHALKAAMELLGNEKGREVAGFSGSVCHGTVPVVIGDGGSTQSLVVARILGVFHIPQVSYFSSCACLSDKNEFPAFLRTMPSDFFQVDALVQLVKHFGWTWVGVIAGDDAYGRGGANIFADEVDYNFLGACVALHEIIPKNRAQDAISSIISNIRNSRARIILVFALEQDAEALFDEVLRTGLTGIQWLASEAWSTATVLSTPRKYHNILQGSMGFAIRHAEIPGLQTFLHRLNPKNTDNHADPFLVSFWEEMFQCSLAVPAEGQKNNSQGKPPCTGAEELKSITNIYSDVSQLRISYNVYKAVYAIIHALKAMRSCVKGKGPFLLQSCPDLQNVQPWQLLHYIKHVVYSTTIGDEIKFDENGDPVAMYDLVNWQFRGNEGIEFVIIGKFDETNTALNQKLQIQEQNILWNGNQTKVPLSVCSSICPPGTRKAIRPNFPICCHDCVVCAAGEISNQTECERCLPEFWSNDERTACIPKQVEFLSFTDSMGITLLVISLFGSFSTCVVIVIFSCHRSTPIVRANNSELSFLLLISLTLCFLCSLTFIGQPSKWSCMLRHTAFGITFVLCISCILGKTIVVLIAFKATLPGSGVMKWFGPAQQKAIIILCTLVQAVICTVWLTVDPPSPHRLMPRESALVILLCDEGSYVAFGLVLGYIGLLACLCLFLAFLARKLPDNFNEARLITFSMLIFCAVWVAFVPAYISSPGKYSTVTEVFAILASSYGLLCCIFAPKCYIILLRPEKNTKKYLMTRTG